MSVIFSRSTEGIDWVQAGRYAAGLDPATVAGGPTNESAGKTFLQKDDALRKVRVADAKLPQNQTGIARISLDAQGNENALGPISGTSWSTVQSTAEITNNMYRLVLPTSNSEQYFRLRQQ